MNSALVSCIVPVFNCERYLSETLDSIFAQTYRPLEVIVVDDGSTDATPVVAAAYGDRIRHLRHENVGPAATRNRGLRAAAGELVAFLDADDLWHADKLARQWARLQARPNVGVCLTYVQNFWISELRGEVQRVHDRHREPMPGYCLSTPLIRRHLFETVGAFDERLAHASGADWFARALDCGIVIDLLPETLVSRRMHQTNRSRQMAESSREEFLRLVKRRLDSRRQRGGDPAGGGGQG